MNKLYVIAKVVFGMLGIYLIISVITSVLTFAMMAVQSFQTYQAWALMVIIGYGVVLFGYIWLVYYLLFRRADIFARRIVGQDELPDPPNPSAWYPFAMRLMVMAAGFLFLQKSILVLSMLTQLIQYNFRSDTLDRMGRLYEQGIFFLIYLAISIYLLCGAPHFVRWHLKKTRNLYIENL